MEIVYAVQDDRRLLPLIEEGWDGECPARIFHRAAKNSTSEFYKSSCIISTTISPGCIFKITFPFLTSGIELILIGSTF